MTQTRFFLAISMIAILGTSSCSRYVRLDKSQTQLTSEEDGKGVSVRINWVKAKGNAIDMHISVKNQYENGVVIRKDSYRLVVGGDEGSLAKFALSEEIGPTRTESGLLIFRFEPRYEGKKAILSINPILEIGLKKRKTNPITFEIPI